MKWLITGGAGFVGCNAARQLSEQKNELIIFDNLSRKGAKENLQWLKNQAKFEFVAGDVRDYSALENVFEKHKDIDVVLHLAAQVAVTTSVKNPREDFEVNTLGTFNVLEAIRQSEPKPIMVNASTNKVYGNIESVEIMEKNGRYQYGDLPFGVPETMSLDFHSPYGCSKGAADQYVCDYVRSYGLKVVNFRQSCIYGYRQFGVEDQGWVAWFTIAAVLGKPITIYGNGKQVRDVLFIDDLIDCYKMAVENIGRASGESYNVGGGSDNQLSLLELLDLLEQYTGKKIKIEYSDWRPGDQKVFVCDIRKAERELQWTPKTGVEEGVQKLYTWVDKNKDLFGGI